MNAHFPVTLCYFSHKENRYSHAQNNSQFYHGDRHGLLPCPRQFCLPSRRKTLVMTTLTDTAAPRFSGDILFPAPNTGTGNVLTGESFQNTATTVTVADGTLGNTADVRQFNNYPCS